MFDRVNLTSDNKQCITLTSTVALIIALNTVLDRWFIASFLMSANYDHVFSISPLVSSFSFVFPSISWGLVLSLLGWVVVASLSMRLTLTIPVLVSTIPVRTASHKRHARINIVWELLTHLTCAHRWLNPVRQSGNAPPELCQVMTNIYQLASYLSMIAIQIFPPKREID